MEEITIQLPSCSQCNTQIIIDSIFCTNCGFPEKGTEKEQAKFHADRILKRSDAQKEVKKISSARKTLYWMAGIFFVFGLFYYINSQEIAHLVVNAILACIFLVLAYWSKQKPFAALLSALLLYVMIIALNAVVEPMTLLKGLLVKIILISFLVKGIYSASVGVKN